MPAYSREGSCLPGAKWKRTKILHVSHKYLLNMVSSLAPNAFLDSSQRGCRLEKRNIKILQLGRALAVRSRLCLCFVGWHRMDPRNGHAPPRWPASGPAGAPGGPQQPPPAVRSRLFGFSSFIHFETMIFSFSFLFWHVLIEVSLLIFLCFRPLGLQRTVRIAICAI